MTAYSPVDISSLAAQLAQAQAGQLFPAQPPLGGRLIIRGGHVIDPRNQIDTVLDVAITDGIINEVAASIPFERGDRIINADSLLVIPGLIDMHLHLHDLFEVSVAPILEAVSDGVAVGLTPGAGNTFMSPALLGAEVDRGLPMNVGVYTGIPNVLCTNASKDELVLFFRGELPAEVGLQKVTRNPITLLTAPFTVGLKDHMGHFILQDDYIDLAYAITAEAGMVFLSHTQDPAHAERMVSRSKGRSIQLTHATAAGCGTHGDPEESMNRIITLVRDNNHVVADFVTSMLRPAAGRRDGLVMSTVAQELAFRALAEGLITILISDGQSDATMKGFGSTQDNLPAIFELAEMGVLTLSEAVATMTSNVSHHLATCTRQPWWESALGHLGAGARANVTIVDPLNRSATLVIINGAIAAIEGRVIREAHGAGGFASRGGWLARTGVGDLPLYN